MAEKQVIAQQRRERLELEKQIKLKRIAAARKQKVHSLKTVTYI